ncbi:MAG: hypothetical protein ACXWDN_14820 [Limisphaerales bacterium]
MKNLLALTLLCTASLTASAVTLPIFDPFVDATSSNGTAYADLSMLVGQTNAQGTTWVAVNTNQNSGIITLTGYAFTNYAQGSALPAPTGSEAAQVHAPATSSGGVGARMNLTDFATNGISNGTVYASMYIRCNDISLLPVNTGTGALQGGIFHIGFSDTVGALSGNPTILGGRWYFHKSATDASKYSIGISKVTSATGGSNPTAYYDTREWSTSDELFVVAGYTFNSGTTNDDVVKLWITPPANTLGAAGEPSPNAQSGTTILDTDLKSIGSFNVMVRNTTQVTSMLFDEVRVGTTWADVTSVHVATVPVPTLNISLLDPNTVQLSWRGDSTGYSLQGTSSLLSSGTPWLPVSGTATTSGTNLIQSDSVSGMKVYRLKK